VQERRQIERRQRQREVRSATGRGRGERAVAADRKACVCGTDGDDERLAGVRRQPLTRPRLALEYAVGDVRRQPCAQLHGSGGRELLLLDAGQQPAR